MEHSNLLSKQTPAVDQPIDSIYDQLRDLAHFLLRQRPAGSISPTDLVHEAFLKLTNTETGFSFENREHAVRTVVKTMRHVLIDRKRRRCSEKRDRQRTEFLLDWSSIAEASPETWLEELDEALNALAVVDSRAAEIVQLRFFGGLTSEEIGSVLKIHERTVRRDWGFAQAWLMRELADRTIR
jgi:RNA polymerase sigma-70 factor, ECF subfamily